MSQIWIIEQLKKSKGKGKVQPKQPSLEWGPFSEQNSRQDAPSPSPQPQQPERGIAVIDFFI